MSNKCTTILQTQTHISKINSLSIGTVSSLLQHHDSTDTSTENVEESSTHAINRQQREANVSFVLQLIYPEKKEPTCIHWIGSCEAEGQITALGGNETTTVQHVTSVTLSIHVNRPRI